ncbi:hypothetical protein B0T17DRAFT_571447 [Bombardia bombarda]|uniref:Uncharacterized protein n=1 Tax=Bombardia bombarda TaxID=252184 RepID=A0AA40CFF5_9PEZI|nr:hypothetical protein B0T17DRAFT_571447 [Bombardia bombarda]
MAADRDEAENTVIVGIDFGTTYSGVAFTWSENIDKMEIITSWDSDLHSNSDEKKAPTAISFGSKGQVTWGYSIPREADQVKWFKLLLLDEDDLPSDVRNSNKIRAAREYLKKHNKKPVDVISLFLRHLLNHANQRIIDTISRSLVNYSKFHIVMTLPAIWPDYARARMREAATRAGMLARRCVAGDTELTFISETEAAALATLVDMDGRKDIEDGDTFVVVDCGGLCGAVFVDEGFVKMLQKKFTQECWDRMKQQSRSRFIHEVWEHGIKAQFDGRDKSKTWTLDKPYESLDRNERRSMDELPNITIKAEDVKKAFDLVVDKIYEMVQDQVRAVNAKKGNNPKYVILVGGFGRCKYLLESLRDQIEDDIEVLQSRGAGPWTAICRGAVIHAATMKHLYRTSIEVQTRISRSSYGYYRNKKWDPTRHDAIDKYWSNDRQRWSARRQMVWLLQEGDDISSKKPIKKTLHRLYNLGEKTVKTSSKIYYSTVSPPSPRFNKSVVQLCTIQWDTQIDVHSLPTFTNSLGEVFYELQYEIEMTCSGASVDFAVYFQGKRQGSKNVGVKYEIDNTEAE